MPYQEFPSLRTDTEKLRKIVRAFIILQFGYCPLIWMNHGRNMNKKINRIQEKALQIMYQEPASDVDALLLKGNSVPIHVHNLHLLMIEIFQSINNSSPAFMRDLFPIAEQQYSLRNGSSFQLPKVQTKAYGIKTVSFLGCRLWNTVPNEWKNFQNIN